MAQDCFEPTEEVAMSSAETDVEAALGGVPVRTVDLKLEVVVIPVSNVDQARDFYVNLGWRIDADVDEDNVRLVQLTPQGSECSIQFGTNITPAPPGSAQWLYLVVSDVKAARDALAALGVDVSEVFHEATLGDRFHKSEQIAGPVRDHASYGSFASFSDPDDNTWLLQEITQRLPGRIDRATASFASPTDLEDALRRASAAHGDHEKRLGQPDPNWPKWYADYMVAQRTGKELPS
jgi:catechol 2,3-dioxygenase-like lactoylglutathione lyase family enzyme